MQGRSFSGRERNCCFLNTLANRNAGGRFANISAASGLDFPDDGRAAALVDWDLDGNTDVWIANRNAPRLRLMRNQAAHDNHFVGIRLTGNGTTTNRDAIGARVELIAKREGRRTGDEVPENRKWIKTLRAGEGFLSQGSKWLHFGLGSANQIEAVHIRWPDGREEEFRGLQVDHRYRLEQGSGTAKLVQRTERKTQLEPSTQQIPATSDRARIPLQSLVTLPNCTYKSFDGDERRLPTKTGRPLLVNLWATWCPPCIAELHELVQRQDEIRAKGIQIVALSVDGMGDDSSDPDAAARLLSQIKFPFTAGVATPEVVGMFQSLHDVHIYLHRRLPVPTSLLIDGQGRVAVIYKGPLSIDDLLQDVTHSKGDRLERFVRSAPIAGRPLAHPHLEPSAINEEARVPFFFGFKLWELGRLDEVATHLTDVLRLKPDAVFVHTRLGKLFWKLQNATDAVAHLEDAIRIDPNFPEAHYNLGIVYEAQEKLPQAKEAYQQALRIQPDYAEAHNNLAILSLNEGELSEATDHFRHALRVRPDYAEAHFNLGAMYNAQGKLPQAKVAFEKALHFKPDYAEAHNNLGAVLVELGELSQAKAAYASAVRINPGYAEAHNNLGILLVKQGKLTQATAAYEHALRINPDYADAHYNLAAVYDTQGKLPEAQAAYEHALRTKPDHAQAHNNLGILLFKQGNRAEAEVHFGLAIRSNPDYAEAHFNLGNVLVDQGKLNQARESFERALRIMPDDPNIHFSLGGIAVGLGDEQAAIAHYRESLRTREDLLSAANNLAWLLATGSDTESSSAEEALRWARHAADSTQHNEPGFLDTLAAAYAASGQFENAIESAHKAIQLHRGRGQEAMADEVQQRLQLYEKNRPYRVETRRP